MALVYKKTSVFAFDFHLAKIYSMSTGTEDVKLGVTMKLKKEKVLEFIQMYSSDMNCDELPKITTRFLSEKLDMQRTNLSSILNQLVKEGKLVKYSGRPVLYQLAGEGIGQEDVFQRLIGYDHSYKEAISTAKAAVLYPEKNPSVLIVAEPGSGIQYFAETVFQFAITAGVLKTKAPFIVFDCKTVTEHANDFETLFLGKNEKIGIFENADGGLLLLKNLHYLSGYDRRQLFSFLKGEGPAMPQTKDYKGIFLCSVSGEMDEKELKSIQGHTNFRISLPSLQELTKKERFELLEKFFKEEAAKINRRIEADTSILHALLLYEAADNIRGLRNDIHTGCANSYARSYNTKNHTIMLVLTDFPNYVRKGIIYYRTYKEEVDKLVLSDCKYTFSDQQILKDNKIRTQSIYQSIDSKKRELKKNKMTEEEIDLFISAQLRSDFRDYFRQLTKRVKERTVLEKVVSEKLIHLVENFLEKAGQETGRRYAPEIFYGICLHLNGCLVKISNRQRISNTEISQLIEKYPLYYQLAKEFSEDVRQEFHVQLDMDELIFLMLFLLEGEEEQNTEKVVTLIVMHGNHCASSVAEVANFMANERTIFAYDLALDQSIKVIYEELKEKIIKINQGKGIILIYDMGSIHNMAESISQESNIPIKCIEIPITLAGIASSNRASEQASLEEVSQYLQENFGNIPYFRVKQDTQPQINENPTDEIPEDDGMEEVFEYLEDQFPQYDMILMRNCLMTFIEQLEYIMNLMMDEDKKIGLIIHMVCLIDKLKQQHVPSVNFMAYDIIAKNGELIRSIEQLLKPLEKAFGVIINDNEIARIISIIHN